MILPKILSSVAASVVFLSALALPADFHKSTSSLSHGRWIKISVDSTGVYKIPYETLAAMGFEDPAKVRVFGRGLLPKSDNFEAEEGVNVVADVPLWQSLHEENALYFYGIGPRYLKFEETPDSILDGRFSRKYKQIYSQQGYYLLSDSREGGTVSLETIAPEWTVTPPAEEDDGAKVIGDAPDYSLAYALHDFDYEQGFTGCGQYYVSDWIDRSNWNIRWNITPPHIKNKSKVALEGGAFADQNMASNMLKMSVGLGNIVSKMPKYKAATLTNLFPAPLYTELSGRQASVAFTVLGVDACSATFIDYWALTYQSETAAMLLSGNEVVVPVPDDTVVSLTLAGLGATSRVWDVADPENVKQLPVEAVADGVRVLIPRQAGSPMPRLRLYDSAADCLTPLAVGEVAPASLHEEAANGADLVIITVPMLREEAERLADIHRNYDGMRVIVAEVEDIYNEYNGGTPSIMAYKSFVRHVRDVKYSNHLNVLLMGPIRADALCLSSQESHKDFIIGYQSNIYNGDGDAHNINDFIGMLDDRITVRLENAHVHCGVGVLPCLSKRDAVRAVDKIERYINEPNYDLVVNKVLGIAGTGDNQMHTKQCKSLFKNINGFFGKTLIHTPLIADSYEAPFIEGNVVKAFNSDYPLTYYLGHGTCWGLNQLSPVLLKGSIPSLKNDMLSFFLFGTCDNTNFDRGFRGIGESMLFDTADGLVGGLVTTRKAYSTQNESMMKLFCQYLGQNKLGGTSVVHPKTVGQAYAEARTQLRTLHENTFQLMCDPALKLVMPILSIVPDADTEYVLVPGVPVTVKGKIATREGEPVTDFSGRVAVKVMAPTVSVLCPNLVTGDEKHEEIAYADHVLATSFGTVTDGVFEVVVETPASQYLPEGVTTSLAFSAYDPSGRRGASGMYLSIVEPPTEEQLAEYADTEPPVIESLDYDTATGLLAFTVSDDRGVNIESNSLEKTMSLEVDGMQIGITAPSMNISNGERMTVEGKIPYSPSRQGEHRATFTAVDYSGNVSVAKLDFSTGEQYALCKLETDVTVTEDVMTFTISETASPSPTGRLMIADRYGQTVAAVPFEGTSVTLDFNENELALCPEGVYSVWVICDGPGYEYSPAVNFALLKPGEGQ